MDDYRPLIACRIGSYGEFVEDAWTHLPSIGIRNVELMCPEPPDLSDLKTKLSDHGLAASSLHCVCDLSLIHISEPTRPY